MKDEAGELHFATRNTELRRLASTSVSADFVNRRMTRSRSRRIVLLLDCCYAGAFERGMTARAGAAMAIEEQFGGRGRAVITASSAMEYAFEGEALTDADAGAPSVFTSALVEGLDTGEADQDQDGRVSLDELYDFVYARVRQATPHQTPSKWAFGLEGDLYVARRARPVAVPSPLPAELQQALEHPLPGVRAATVEDLGRLLAGTHAGLALAARRALAALVDDDSRRVAAAATAALTSVSDDDPVGVFPADPGVGATATAPTEPKAAAPPPEQPEVEVAPQAAATTTPHTDPSAVPRTATEAERTHRSTEPDDAGRRRTIGWLTAASAALLFGSLLTPFVWEERLHEIASEGALATVLLALVVAAVSWVALSRRAPGFVGLGLVVGVGAGTTVLVVSLLSVLTTDENALRIGYWLQLAGVLLLGGAATTAAGALRQDPAVRLPRGWSRSTWGGPTWSVTIAGAVATLALVAHIVDLWELMADPDERFRVHATLWLVVLTAVVPMLAVRVAPRRLAASLLGGWSVTATILFVERYGYLERALEEFGWDPGRVPLIAFGGAVIMLLVAAVSLGFRATTSSRPATTQDVEEEQPPAPA